MKRFSRLGCFHEVIAPPKWSLIHSFKKKVFPCKVTTVFARACPHVPKEVTDPWVSFMFKINCFPKIRRNIHKAEERGKSSSQSSSAILLKATSTDLLLLWEQRKRPLCVSEREHGAGFTVYLYTCLKQRPLSSSIDFCDKRPNEHRSINLV